MNSFVRRYRPSPEDIAKAKPKLLITDRALEILTLAGINPMTVKGTGKGGNITARDAKNAVSKKEITSREEEE